MNKLVVKGSLFLLFIWTCLSIYFVGDSDSASSNSVWISVINLLVFVVELLSLLFIGNRFGLLLKNSTSRIVVLWLCFLSINVFAMSTNHFVDWRQIAWWPLVFLLFFCFFRERKNFDRNFEYLRVWSFYIILVTIFLFFLIRSSIFGVNIFEVGASLNQIFYIVLLSPYLAFVKKKWLKYSLLFLILFLAFLSFKRSALIVMGLVLLNSFYFDFISNSKSNFFLRIAILISLSISIIFSFNYVDNQLDNYLSGRIQSIEDDRGSGRLDLYTKVLDNFAKQPIESKFMGLGHDGVRKSEIIWETKGFENQFLSAHNDFVEILFDYGFLGFIIYLFFVSRIVINMFKIRTVSRKLFEANVSSVFILLVMSMVSHLVLYPSYFIYLVMLWGVTAAVLNNFKNESTCKLV